jgi:riboflavin kinase/FMN adenylyltransferase
VGEAAHSLGYWWQVTGNVIRGDGRGRTIGFPTANLCLADAVELLEGIYAVWVRYGGLRHPAAGYVGRRPTFSTGAKFLEVHVLDFTGDLYGRSIDVLFSSLIRPDMKFSSVGELIERMREDCAEAHRRLAELATNDPMEHFALGRLQAEGLL